MPFLRNEFLKIFENFLGPFYDYVIFKDENNLWSNLELKIKAKDLNLSSIKLLKLNWTPESILTAWVLITIFNNKSRQPEGESQR